MKVQNADNLINQLNTQKIFINATLTAVFFTIYGFYYDFFICKMPLTVFNVTTKFIFILIPLVLLYPFKSLTLYQRILILIANYTIYCPYYIVQISITYAFASLQLFFITSNIFLLEKRDYLIFSTVIFTSTIATIYITNNPYPQLEHLDSLASAISENFVTLFALCFVSYFYTHSKRIQFLKEEFKFSNLGKASSFLIHEISKPIFTKNNTNENSDDTKNLKDLISITKYMIGGKIPANEFQEINLKSTIDNVVLKLNPNELTEALNITIKNNIPEDILISTSKKGFEIIFANLFKNSLEALAPFYDKKEFQEKLLITLNYDPHNKILSIKNPILDLKNLKSFQNWEDLSFTTKEGHQGVGLHIAKTLASKANIDFTRQTTDNSVVFFLKFNY